MFLDEELINHIETKNTIEIDSLIIAEWNQNDLSNIENYGNYRWRPSSASVDVFRNLNPSYDPNDLGDFYTGALESQYISQYRVDSAQEPLKFLTDEAEMQLYYSLKECFKPFRPRSGINKMLYLNNKFVDGIRSGQRPRYYFSSRKDQFKYWTSYRKEAGQEVGISSKTPIALNPDNGYQITDCAPFVVYKDEVLTNRIVVKMQTNIAAQEVIGIDGQIVVPNQIRQENSVITDPLSDRSKSSIPLRWKIQYLDSLNNWNDAISFNENSARLDGSSIVDWDGYVEISYGIKIPEKYKSYFSFIDYLTYETQVPENGFAGQAYIVGENINNNAGTLYIWDIDDLEWKTFSVEYGFSLVETDDTKRAGIVKDLVNPKYYFDNEKIVYRDFTFIKGIRIVVESMISPDRPFDLIEMSPRLKADLTDRVIDFEISKDIAATDYGLPVGALIASTGQINLSNHDGAFTRLNTFNKDLQTGSIIANNLRPQIKFDFYETILNVNGYDKFVPLKTLYSENSADSYGGLSDVSLSLRDAYFRLESENANSIFLQNCTLTMAVAILLDNIGFGNYVFKNITTANDPVIPFFFVEPDVSVAEVLQRLAQSTQTAMFFDEYNNFVVMPKEYLMPDISVRDTDSSISDRLINLYGQKKEGKLPNIEFITGVETKIINNGQINYTTRYIQKEISRLEQASLDLSERTYAYKSSVLWELGDQEELRTINQQVARSGYALGAASLNSSLGSVVPYIENNEIKENIIDVGENVIWLPRFQGYLYANGEVIRYDAQEYAVSGVGTVWISNNSEYQKYFSKLTFNGKMIPTGNLRIYVEPFYETLPYANQEGLEEGVVFKNGQVKSHGRGQFGTRVVEHNSGLSSFWSDISNRRAFRMNSDYLFKTEPAESIKYPPLEDVSLSTEKTDEAARTQSSVTGKIANFMKKTVSSESNSSTSSQTEIGSIQSSSMILTGAKTSSSSYTPRDLITFVYKDFSNENDFKHFGTRMRIVGKQIDENNTVPDNSTTYFTVNNNNETSYISGGSGGLGIMVNPINKSGYYFEIMSLSKDNIVNFQSNGASYVLENVVFYKVMPGNVRYPHYDQNGALVTNDGKVGSALPIKLWGTSAKILADEGKFVGMDRLSSQDNPTVYDLGVEFERIGNSVKFYLYLNNSLIATVIDNSPLPNLTSETNFNMCLFVRGASKCMFDNIYALKNRAIQTESVTAISGNGATSSVIPALGNNKISISDALRKYAISGIVQSTYLSSIGTEKPPGFDIYFEEFGTIMRECAYFNIKYDQAYPALVAKLIPPFNNEKTYTISGFLPGSYGAEFLIFNSTDKAINLSDSSANRVMIAGITFTQNISNVLSVDDFFGELTNLSDPVIVDNVIKSPEKAQKVYENIKNSRALYGNKSFTVDSVYIQNEDSAKDLMRWIIDKTMKTRKVITVNTFATPHIQLGDIVKIDYDMPEGVKFVDPDKRFTVTSMKYSKSSGDVKISLTLVEV